MAGWRGDAAPAGRGRQARRAQKKTLTPSPDQARSGAEFDRSQPLQQTDNLGQQDSHWWEGGQAVEVGETFETRKLTTPLDRLTRSTRMGRRSTTKTSRKRGRYVQARPSPGDASDLAFDATLRAAAPLQVRRERKGVAFSVRSSDYQKKVRVRKAANLVLFVVDASWSMAVAERMQATKGAIMSLLTDAYQRRDRVGLVVFQKDQARVVLPPTNSVELAQRALKDIPVGGKTPLSAGLSLAHLVLDQEKRQHPDVMPLMIILTDGAGNVSMCEDIPAQQEAYQIAEQIAAEKIRTVVINMEHVAFDQGLAAELAVHLGAPCYTLKELKAESLYKTVKDELQGSGG